MNNLYDLKIFEWIDKEVIDSILSNSKEIKYEKWSIIILEWEESNWEWYILKEWNVEVKINWTIVASLWDWEIFWEIALLNEENRTATVTAISNVVLIVLNLQNFIHMINNDTNKINKEIIRRIEENIENKEKTFEEII